jgi:hypothetical protein
MPAGSRGLKLRLASELPVLESKDTSNLYEHLELTGRLDAGSLHG